MNKFYFIISLIVILLKSTTSSATGQIPDYLIQGKDTLAIQANPLEIYFKDNPIKDDVITSRSTALWRGYIAYFKIINNILVVHDIYMQQHFTNENGQHTEKLTSIYHLIFGDSKNFNCTFYNGVLICPSGKILEYVHMGYSSIYENYKLIEIKDGQFFKEANMSADEFMNLKLNHFRYFKKTEEYKKTLAETISMFEETDKEMDKRFKDIFREEKKRKKQNKYLYEKEKEIERLKSAENFIFIFTTNNIKTIDIPN